MKHLATYLNDHLAGSVAAVELLEHLEETHKGTDVGRFLAELRAEVESDRHELKTLMGRLDIDESVMRKATAWLAGKVTELKLRLDDTDGDALRLFESLEALSLGLRESACCGSHWLPRRRARPRCGSSITNAWPNGPLTNATRLRDVDWQPVRKRCWMETLSMVSLD